MSHRDFPFTLSICEEKEKEKSLAPCLTVTIKSLFFFTTRLKLVPGLFFLIQLT